MEHGTLTPIPEIISYFCHVCSRSRRRGRKTTHTVIKTSEGGEPGESEAWAVDHRHEVLGSKERSGHQGFAAAVSCSSFHSPQCWQWHVGELSPPYPVLAPHFHSHSLQVSSILLEFAWGRQMKKHNFLGQSP